MLKKKLLQRKLLSVSLAALFAVGIGAPSLAHANTKEAVASSGTTVYLTVEKSVLGQGLIQAPVKVTIPDSVQNPTIYDALKTQFGENQDGMKHAMTQYGPYVSAFADKNETLYDTAQYQHKDKLPNVCWSTNKNQEVKTNATDKFLSEKEYNGVAGWVTTLNDSKDVTIASTVKDGDVIRCQFSLAAGCDLGYKGWIPQGEELTEYGYYNWQEHAAFFEKADKSELIRKMANEGQSSTNYDKLMNALNNLQISQKSVDKLL